MTCVDVGASYYPHPAWELFRRSDRTTWIAIDPNAQNLDYVARWVWPSAVRAVGEAVSEDGAEKTLYVTNVDSGSSLLKPVIPDGMRHRIESTYFFPLAEKKLSTRTLGAILGMGSDGAPMIIKLDTQGTEFAILRGLGDRLTDDRLICVELEATLLARPLYEGASKLVDVQHFLEQRGFELVSLKLMSSAQPRANRKLSGNTVLTECDAVFLLRPDVLAQRPVDQKLAMLGCYVAYGLYGEALHLTRQLRTDLVDSPARNDVEALRTLLS